MALLWIEGFEGYGTTIDTVATADALNRRYPINLTLSDMRIAAGRTSGYALRMKGSSYMAYLRTPALTTHNTLVVGFAMKMESSTGAVNFPFLSFYDGAQQGVNLRHTAANEFNLYTNSTLIATTTGFTPTVGSWHYLELKVVCGNPGSYELRIDGVTALSGTANTKAGTNNYHTVFQISTGNNALTIFHLDDLYCCDGSGTANNDFLGNQKVVAIHPNGTGDSSQWTPASGTDNFAMVDEQVVDDETTYVEAATVGLKDLYHYQSLSGLSQINGIQVNTDARETDATNYHLITLAKSGATESADAGQVIGSTSYLTKRRILELDPSTLAPWTASGVNAAQFGVKL